MKYTNLGLVEYVKSKLNVPTIYMLGGFGRILTKSAIDKRVANGCNHTKANYNRILQGIGKQWFDCVGLIKAYIWDDGKVYNNPKGSDQNTNMMLANNQGSGPIGTLPEIPGVILYMPGHVGVYIGNGDVIECTAGFNAWGVIRTKLSQRKWTHWLKYKFIEYIEPVKEIPKPIKKYLNLPAVAEKWRIYPLDKAPIVGNEKGFLKPSNFGGLSYEILAYISKDVVTIQTRDFGKVNIYMAINTGATVTDKPLN